jgi:hypothetical protein
VPLPGPLFDTMFGLLLCPLLGLLLGTLLERLPGPLPVPLLGIAMVSGLLSGIVLGLVLGMLLGLLLGTKLLGAPLGTPLSLLNGNSLVAWLREFSRSNYILGVSNMIDYSVPFLRSGTGDNPEDGGCIMQVIDWIDRCEWSDEPVCVHPILRIVAIQVNDDMEDGDRQRLLALAPRLMNTASDLISPHNIQMMRDHKKLLTW